MTSRREFLQRAATVAAASGLPPYVLADRAESGAPVTLVDVRRPPDGVFAQTDAGIQRLTRSSDGAWRSGHIEATLAATRDGARIRLSAPADAVLRLHLRWRGRMDSARLVLGDAWERGYGDLEWRGIVPDRVMPWYFVAWDGRRTDGYGVRTRANALCFWQMDADGVSLWADVRSGGAGVRLGARVLDVCEVSYRPGRAGESAFAALHSLCRQLSPAPRLPARPAYGSNDWYYAYGKNSAASFAADAGRIAELSPDVSNRPFAVVDDGWQPERSNDKGGDAKKGVGLWDRGNEKFSDMQAAAAAVRSAGARPGIWIRPLLAPADAPDSWRLARDRAYLDPTVPEAREKIAADFRRLAAWGFELIKHDYTTYDIFGRWGFEMGTALTKGGWTFAQGPTHTTAEVINALYDTMRTAAGDALILGCNTVSHLSAGVFELCRTGDDTSGTEWARTRKMGVNTLAFRAAQHGTFYAADPDCVGVTKAIPWSFNRQWLDLVARSGTALFVSLAPDALGAPERRDLRAALALAAKAQPLGEPLDWQGTVWPARWRLAGATATYDWVGDDGMGPPR
ncbi:MAG: glycoside hydrolase clan [Gemmatimonadetes bacterium]|nr:glycoside hydrolase clan [Gemmatimonadota bacterium]